MLEIYDTDGYNMNRGGISSKYEKELKDFLESIRDDFFIKMNDYTGFQNKPFNTDNLTVLDMVCICEIYALSSTNSVIHPLDVAKILGVVVNRITQVGGKLGLDCMGCVENLACFIEFKNNTVSINTKFINMQNDAKESNIHNVAIRGSFT